ncbi:MAG: hypothetical protein EOP56_06415 [Sphingobacteriales bacterium]|nr:MAG: hypothetical protein EOP56_06415 [Sphingobacteriales bacterium]
MKKIVGFAAFLFLAACSGDTDDSPETSADSLAPSVVVPPDTADLQMPVQPLDTSQTDMPVVNPDSGRVKPL